ncbi:calcium-binding protein [Kordiimonas lipolytica]|uniref:Calcium-binding protein n=1 Tax=Kordiimonas lipolytica TaxID=1662421 RepID=A0ABV8UCR8_9PROT|nr:calcium-binding protein [Kordiimonas lipolytica]
MSYIEGTDTDDVLTAGDNDILAGRDGNDTLSTGDGNHTSLHGGDGDDLYVVNWETHSADEPYFTWISETESAAYPESGWGNDTLDLSAVAGNLTDIRFSGTYSNIFGIRVYEDGEFVGQVDVSHRNLSHTQIETLKIGTDSLNIPMGISGAAMNGIFFFGATDGDDIITTDSLTLDISGLEGNDTITLGSAPDAVALGEGGQDVLHTGAIRQSLYGGSDDDILYHSLAGPAFLFGGNGSDRYILDWDIEASTEEFEVSISELGSTSVEGEVDILDISNIAHSADNIAFSGSSFYHNLKINILNNNHEVIASIDVIGFFGSNPAMQIENLVLGNDTIDLTGYETPSDLNVALNVYTVTEDGDLIEGVGNQLEVSGASGDDTIVGSGEYNKLRGGEGNDLLQANGQHTFLYGDGGHDRLVANASAASLFGGTGRDTLVSGEFERVYTYGGDDGDRLTGSSNDDHQYGQRGRDNIHGNDGNDAIDGGADGDFLFGGDGNDEITGRTGGDQIWTGAGDDLGYGGKDQDTLGGGLGADTLSGDDGDDIIFGGSEDDVINGGDGNDELYGGADADIISGGAGNDTLYGGTGADTLNGGSGDDILRPGSEADVLIFESGSGSDIVEGFSLEEDTLNLSGTSTDFTDLASVQAAATDTTEGLLIDLGGGDSVLLTGVTMGELATDNFIF